MLKQPWLKLVALATTIGLLSSCGSSDSESTGYYQIYNVSNNSPTLYLSLDDTTYSSASYQSASSYIETSTGTQTLDISWKDDNGELQSVYEQALSTKADQVQFVAVTGDIAAPNVLTYQFDYENPDDEDEQFTFRVLALQSDNSNVELYIAQADETINEAQLIGNFDFGQLSDSQYFSSGDSYKFYIKDSATNEIVYQSASIYFGYTAQYIIAINSSNNATGSPYTLDKIAQSSYVEHYPDQDSSANFNIYNAIAPNDLLPDYTDQVNVYIDQVDNTPELANIAQGQLSDTLTMPFGDYQLSLSGDNDQVISQNQKLTLPANSYKTVFLYQTVEQANLADDDNTNDETKLYINSLVTDNSNKNSYYSHQIKLINLLDEYDGVTVSFVRSDETLEDPYWQSYNSLASPVSVELANNTYKVFVTAKQDNTELILAQQSLTLDEQSSDLFLVIRPNGEYTETAHLAFIEQNQ